MRHTNSLHICPDDRVSHLRTLASAGSVQGILITLLNGASLHLFNLREDGVINLADWLIEEEITVYRSTPTVFRHLLRNRAPANLIPERPPGEPARRTRAQERRRAVQEPLWPELSAPERLWLHGVSDILPPLHRPQHRDHWGYRPPSATRTRTRKSSCWMTTDNRLESVAWGRSSSSSRFLALGYWRKPELHGRGLPARPARRERADLPNRGPRASGTPTAAWSTWAARTSRSSSGVPGRTGRGRAGLARAARRAGRSGCRADGPARRPAPRCLCGRRGGGGGHHPRAAAGREGSASGVYGAHRLRAAGSVADDPRRENRPPRATRARLGRAGIGSCLCRSAHAARRALAGIWAQCWVCREWASTTTSWGWAGIR